MIRDDIAAERLLAKFDRPLDGCWTWTAYRGMDGYGRVSRGHGRSPALAHRAVYELVLGSIPNGMQIDHLCRNRGCVRPDHLEPVSQAENIRRGESPTVLLNRSQTCKRGHGAEHFTKNGTSRRCLQCRRDKRKAGEWS